MNKDISPFLAFAAGLLSFLSPCVLPLIPSWLILLGGLAGPPAEQTGRAEGAPETPAGKAPGGKGRNFTLTGLTISFTLGFSLLFTLLSGVMAGTMLLLGGINRIIQILSGIIVILLGLHTLFGLLPFLNYEKRLHPVRVRRGLSGAFFAGLAFGAGWTPCVGPILGSILLLAGQGGTLGTGVFYLGVYSAGLALPFIGAALIADLSLEGGLRKYLGVLNAHIPLFKRISGILLIIIGVFILSGRFSALSAALARLSQGY